MLLVAPIWHMIPNEDRDSQGRVTREGLGTRQPSSHRGFLKKVGFLLKSKIPWPLNQKSQGPFTLLLHLREARIKVWTTCIQGPISQTLDKEFLSLIFSLHSDILRQVLFPNHIIPMISPWICSLFPWKLERTWISPPWVRGVLSQQCHCLAIIWANGIPRYSSVMSCPLGESKTRQAARSLPVVPSAAHSPDLEPGPQRGSFHQTHDAPIWSRKAIM
jgi:hypothetical protein